MRKTVSYFGLLSTCFIFLMFAAPASASTIWTDWTSATAGAPGSAAGTVNGVSVTYAGEVLANRVINGTAAATWAPATSFIGGTVDTSPSSVGDMITLAGADITNTITFGTPLTNPVFAIWSLGAPSAAATFTFNITPTFEVGGPNVSFGGSAITVNGNTVSGREGNGVVQFTGTFSSISWTDTPEFFYGFTVGVNGPVTSVTPEPASLVLMGTGIAGLLARRRTRR